MRKIFSLFSLILLSGFSQAESSQSNTFQCVDKTSFEVNAACMQNKISQSVQYKEMELNLVKRAETTDLVNATMTFHPETMHIEIVAHKDALKTETKLVASNTL